MKKFIVILISIVVGIIVLTLGGVFDVFSSLFSHKVEISDPATGVYYLYSDHYEKDEHSAELLAERDKYFVDLNFIVADGTTVHYYDDGISIQTPENRFFIDGAGTVSSSDSSIDERIDTKKIEDTYYISLADLIKSETIGEFGVSFDVSEGYVIYKNDNLGYQRATIEADSCVYANSDLYDEYYREMSKGKTPRVSVRGVVGEQDVEGYAYRELIGEIEYTYFFSESPRLTGYVDSDKVALAAEGVDKQSSDTPKSDNQEKMVLVWEAVYVNTVDVGNIGEMSGLNTVSPTWYTLGDSEGALNNIVDPNYISWARNRGYEIHPLITNDSDIELTSAFLASRKAQLAFIDALVSQAIENGYEGYNLDFEHIYLEDRDAYSHFVNMLCFEMHKWGLVVSVDVNVMDGADNWSKCFDHKVLGEVADYLVIMAYDEHHPTSQVPGSNASYGWVEYNLNKIAEVVDPRKIVLGVPFYTRIWYTADSGVTSDVLGMLGTDNYLQTANFEVVWDEQSKQRKATYNDGTTVTEIWIEDADSLRAKVDFAKKKNFAGVAAWRRGFESSDAWEAIDINK